MVSGNNIFLDAAILLGGAAIAAPLFKKIGLGTVLGYLCVGIILGPILNYIRDGESVLHVAEIGVVLLLFLVGLELKPARLWDMRHEIFGLGGLQVLLSGTVLSVAAWVVYFNLSAAIIVGFGLALSSTAFALQLLEESGDDRLAYGKRSFGVLLFQDLAIAPLLILVPLLAVGTMELSMDGFQQLGIAVGSIAVLIFLGRYALNPLFGIIAATGAREAVIAAALFIVVGAAVLMQYAGLSMAMGAFIAGVMLAESSYRHELEADIEPFRGIFLGLFFIAVGLAVDLKVVLENLWLILALVPVIMLVKVIILYLLARMFRSNHSDAIRIGFTLSQSGEFGFVLFTAATSAALLAQNEASFLIACVTLSMAFTPLAVKLSTVFLAKETKEEIEEDFEGADANVLMIGFSRLGQIASQVLLAGGSHVTVLDNSAERIRQAQTFGFRIYFGDGTRKDVLRAAGIEKTKIVAICTRKRATTDKIVKLIKDDFPHIKLYVRSYDRNHSLELLKVKNLWEIRETYESALIMGRVLLEGVGHPTTDAELIVDDVRQRDTERMKLQFKDGMLAGMENLHTKPVPEPLFQPRHRADGTPSTKDKNV
jgi:CPA2 family monovalent cation:H+ antiporter-2